MVGRAEDLNYGLEVFQDGSKPAGTDVELAAVAIGKDAPVEDLGEVFYVDEVSAFLDVAPDFNGGAFDSLVYDIAVAHGLLNAVNVIGVSRMIGIDVGHSENEAFKTIHLMIVLYKLAGCYFANGIDAVVGHVVDLRTHVGREEVHAFLEVAVIVRDGLHEEDPVGFYSLGVFQNVQGSLDVDVDVSFRMIAFHMGGQHGSQMDYGVNVLSRKIVKIGGILNVAAAVSVAALGVVIGVPTAGGDDLEFVRIKMLSEIIDGVNAGGASGAENKNDLFSHYLFFPC